MDQVSVFDAKNTLSALLTQVEQGNEITITRRGKPVARLVPQTGSPIKHDTAERLRALRRSIAARGESLSWTELKTFRDDGRK